MPWSCRRGPTYEATVYPHLPYIVGQTPCTCFERSLDVHAQPAGAQHARVVRRPSWLCGKLSEVMPWDVGAFRAGRKGKLPRRQACTCAARNGLWFAQVGFGNAGKPVSSLNPQRAFLGFVRGLETEMLHSVERRDI